MGIISARVTESGILAPDYADILQQLKIQFWSIYGSDANLDPDSQDGQFLSALAQIVYDCNNAIIATYNGFSPATAQGVQLSSLVKLNGLRRDIPTNSTAVVRIIGEAGITIIEGLVGDNLNLNTRWRLPDIVQIPITGQIDVTATCMVEGDISAGPNTLTNILTPTRGWQSVTNPDNASPGLPVESDATLRVRQSRSTAIPALTVIESIYASVAAVNGVGRLFIYENDTDTTDSNGIPSHSIAVVVSGGDAQQIADAIASKKTPGTGTFGDTSVIVTDNKGIPNTIRFDVLENIKISVRVAISPLFGYVSTTGDVLIANVVEFVNNLGIGEDSYLARLYSPANLGGVGLGATYVVTSITQGLVGDPLTTDDIIILFNQAASIDIEDVILVVS